MGDTVTMKRQKKDPFVFYNAEFCPFGQRAWIAMHEKNIPHDYVCVNYFNPDDPITQEFYTVSLEKTVPAAKHNGNNIFDSLPFLDYVEAAFPDSPSIFPKEPMQAWRTRHLMKKHSETVVPLFYRYLMNQDRSKDEELMEKYTGALDELQRDLIESSEKGPFFLGEEFTALDIAFFPFMERATVLLPHYRGYKFPSGKGYERLTEWIDSCSNRDSVKATTGPRDDLSMSTLPFKERERGPFLIEMYIGYAAGDVPKYKEQLRNVKPPMAKA